MSKQNWTDQEKALMRWLCLPPSRQDPKTITELAKRLGKDRETLYYQMNKPGFNEAKARMAVLVQLELDPKFRQTQSENMLRPEGWQERVAYYRYQYKDMLALANAGLLDEVKLLGDGQQPLSVEYAQEQLKSLPPEQQYIFLNILQSLQVIAVEQAASTAITNAVSYNVETLDGQEPTVTPGDNYSKHVRDARPKRKRQRVKPVPLHNDTEE